MRAFCSLKEPEMTEKEIIKLAKQNLQEVQRLKDKTDQAKQIQDCGFFLIVNQVVTKKMRKNCKKIWWIGKVVVTLQSV